MESEWNIAVVGMSSWERDMLYQRWVGAAVCRLWAVEVTPAPGVEGLLTR